MRASRMIEMGGVRNVFFPPTALRMLKADGREIPGLRSVASGGRAAGGRDAGLGAGAPLA